MIARVAETAIELSVCHRGIVEKRGGLRQVTSATRPEVDVLGDNQISRSKQSIIGMRAAQLAFTEMGKIMLPDGVAVRNEWTGSALMCHSAVLSVATRAASTIYLA